MQRLCSILFSALEHNIFGNVSRLKLINSPKGEKLLDLNSAKGCYCQAQNSKMWIYPTVILLNDFRLVTLFLLGRGQHYIVPDDWALWMGVGCVEMETWGTVHSWDSLASWETVRVAHTGTAPWLRMSCTPVQWPGSGLYSTPVQCSTHLANYGLLPGDTDLGTAQSGSGTRQDNISHPVNFYQN